MRLVIDKTSSLDTAGDRDTARTSRDAVIACAVLVVLGIAWFATLPAGILVGDDLYLVHNAQHGGYASSPLASLVQPAADKYRPILTLLFSLLIPMFGSDFRGYEAVNLLVDVGNSVLVLLIAWHLSRGSRIVSLSASIAFLISRFAYYAVMQVFGLMEGLALGLMLLVVYEAVRAYETRQISRFNRALIWFALAVFTDERYVVVVVFLLACIALYPGVEASGRRALVLAGAAVAIVVANFALKTFVLHSQFFMGTAGQRLEFDPASIATFFAAGFLNVVGFNIGSVYLAGRAASDGPLGLLFGALFSAGVFIAAIAYFRRLPRSDWLPVALAAALFLPVLLSASIAVRQDPRWLYAPFAVFLLVLAGAAGTIGHGKRTNAVALSMVAVCVLSAVYYRSSINSIYFFYSMAFARSVYDTLVHDPPETVVFQTHGQEEVQQWIFAKGAFFDEYRLNDAVRYVDKLDSGAEAALPSSPLKVFDVRGPDVADITPTVRRPQGPGRPAESLRTSLADEFPHGTINSHRRVTTPTGEGAFIMDWPSQGGPLRSLTVLAGFRYEFARLQIRSGDALLFSAADPYTEGGGTHAFVEASTDGKRIEIFHSDFKPASATSDPAWQAYDISLARFAGKTVSLTFGVDALTGDQTAAWLAFANPRIVNESGRPTTTPRPTPTH
jgi:hypothetical protein